MASTDARPIPLKNTAYRVTFPILDADGDLVTGASGLDSEVSLDGAGFGDCTNEATEIATSSGMYYLDLTSGEMNADTVAIIVKTSTVGAKTTPIVLYPEEAGDIRVNVTEISGDATAADNAESFFDGTGYAGTNNVIPTVTTVTNPAGAIRSNTLQSGSTSTTAKLDAGASATNDLYNGALIVLTGGTGAGQCNAIVDYDGTSKVADVAHTWITTPDNTTTFSILPQAPEALSAWNSAALNEAKMGKNSLYAAIQKNTGEVDTVTTAGQAITKRTGGTEHFRQALTTDAAADPITIVGAAS